MRSLRTTLQSLLLLLGSSACSDSPDERMPCPPGQQDCADACVVLGENPDHCGACDRRCSAEQVCSKGRCAEACDEGHEPCERSCVDIDQDERNCGECGLACAPGVSCEDGRCACPDGTTACDGVCAALESAPENCGACGADCAGGPCEGGTCSCLTGWTLCDGECVNLDDDPKHCGSCERACEADAACTEGRCRCPDGHTDCGGAIGCVDLERDATHCGTCGNDCGAAACREGSCFCPSVSTFCEGECVDLQSDPLHCGACGRSCEDRPNASGGVCAAGACKLDCAPNFEDCDEDPVNGCETRVSDDVQHCGTCGNHCQSPRPNTQGECTSGACGSICKPGWEDCDQEPENGCEADLNSASNCGSCGEVCDGPCAAGACSGAVQIAAGTDHSCALATDGSLYCWGDNSGGAVGPDAAESEFTATRVPGLGPVQQVAAGGRFTCALLRTGEVACWGDGGAGQLGNGSLDSQPLPTIVPGLDQVVQISASGSNACALRTSGELLCWGRNTYGQIADGTTEDAPRPVPVSLDERPTRVVAGQTTCVLTEEKRVWCWGRNATGVIGDGTTDDRHTPFRIPSLENVKSLAMTTSTEAACVLLESGEVRCWGSNGYGQLGDGTQERRGDPRPVAGLEGKEVAGLGMGGFHSCAFFADGKAMCWGHNRFGQVGNGKYGVGLWEGAPVEVKDIGGEVVEMDGGGQHTCARRADGRIWCWGFNNKGQVGHPNDKLLYLYNPAPVQWR